MFYSKGKFFISVILILAACYQTPSSQQYPNPATPTALHVINMAATTSTILPALTSTPAPSPTPIQLPYKENSGSFTERQYCEEYLAKLSISDSIDLSEDDITIKLMALYLDHFNTPEAPDFCRIDGYNIGSITYDEKLNSSSLYPINGFMRRVRFSVKLIQTPSFWIPFPSTIDQQNWEHLWLPMAIHKIEDEDYYTIKFAIAGG